MGKIFYVMGKSSSGKDTIYKELRILFPELHPIVLYTTRPIRQGETDGVEYFFVGEKELSRLRKEGRVIELRTYQTVHGDWNYFTAEDGQIHLEKHSYLGIGTLESYAKMKKHFAEEALIPIYIEAEDGKRLSRALERERMQKVPKYAEMCRRFLADAEDFSKEKLIAAGITKHFENDSLESCIQEITLYIQGQL